MKKLFRTSLFFLAFLNIQILSQWEIINEGFKGWINTIDFVNENVGWIAGSNGTLLKTSDGGENWVDILSSNENWNLSQVDFINESVGWAVGSKYDSTGSYAIIIKSLDGGYNWLLQKQIQQDVWSNAIYVIDENHAYTSVDNKIYKTTDGGTNWIDVSPNLPERHYFSMWFPNPGMGLVVGKYYNGTRNIGVILRTNNGGSSWNQTIVNEFSSIYDLQFLDNSTGYFRANNDTVTFLFKTNDLCVSWQLKAQSRYGINSYQYTDSNTVYAVLADSINYNIMKSIDGGINWQTIPSFSIHNCGIDKIYFDKTNNGLIIGSTDGGSVLLRSNDSGHNWILKKFSYPLTDVCFINQDTGFLIGSICRCGGHGCWTDGRIFLIKNSGETWDFKYSTEYYLQAFVLVNDFAAFSLEPMEYSRGGVPWGCQILKTSDTGNNWFYIYRNWEDSLGYSFNGSDISFIDEENGFVVGRYGDSISSGAGILKTIDGGESWNLGWVFPDTANYEFNLKSIHFINSTGWAVGDGGIIVKYTPQIGWVKLPSVTDLPLKKVFFTDDNHGWIAGGYQNDNDFHPILLKTTNGGVNWNAVPNVPYLIKDIAFLDNNLGWAIGYDSSGVGGILETADGGNTWSIDTGNLPAQLNALHIKDNYGWAVGENGLILRTTDAGAVWVEDERDNVYPTEFVLEQNYPNPFNPTTKIKYSIPTPPSSSPLAKGRNEVGFVSLKVYDVLGREVVTLVNEEKDSGVYEVEFNPESSIKNPASGVYFYQLRAGSYVQTRKMILLK
jgi:photosystem II stability/assembly factor-like uncharacterized protein